MMKKDRYVYDTEFLEDGRTVELISIAFVRESDGAEYYAVNADMPIHRIREHPWLMANVVPLLPMKQIESVHKGIMVPTPDLFDPRVKPHRVIAQEVETFLRSGQHRSEER